MVNGFEILLIITMIIRLSVLLLMCTCMLGAQAFYYTVGQDMECDTVLHSMDVDRTAAQF